MVKFGVFWVSSGRVDQLVQAPIDKSGPDGQKWGKSGYFGGFEGVKNPDLEGSEGQNPGFGGKMVKNGVFWVFLEVSRSSYRLPEGKIEAGRVQNPAGRVKNPDFGSFWQFWQGTYLWKIINFGTLNFGNFGSEVSRNREGQKPKISEKSLFWGV